MYSKKRKTSEIEAMNTSVSEIKIESIESKGGEISTIVPNMPTGLSDFRTLRTEKNLKGAPYWFADKTLLIQDLLEGDITSLLTRPRRFGKTLNLSILK